MGVFLQTGTKPQFRFTLFEPDVLMSSSLPTWWKSLCGRRCSWLEKEGANELKEVVKEVVAKVSRSN